MNKIYMMIVLTIGIALSFGYAACAGEPQGTADSRPNVSGGYDFYDASGNKTGSSSKRAEGGYDYYDKHGNFTGSIKTDAKKGTYEYYDYENIKRGTGTKHPYGGYQYKQQKESIETPEQADIRRDYKYKDTYGSGVETLPPEVLQGKK